MPRTALNKRNKRNIEAQFALADRVLNGINESIDAQIERACNLEVERALALYRAGKATLHDADKVLEEARRRVG